MKKLFVCIFGLYTLAAFICSACAFESRNAMREAWSKIPVFSDGLPFETAPSAESPYKAGVLSPEAIKCALDTLNFCRAVAGLDAVEESAIYTEQCQHGAVLLAALDHLEHDAPRPGDMDEPFYLLAHLATEKSNIARFNWMRPPILQESVVYFLRDDGDINLDTLGHRRWLLNPKMRATGFGLCNSKTGMTYAVIYAHDQGNETSMPEYVAWPSEGVFPVEFMHAQLAWCLVLNPEVFDVSQSDIRVTLSCQGEASDYSFVAGQNSENGRCSVCEAGYGYGPAVLFRPNLSGRSFVDYEQNQRWTVTVSGLAARTGEKRTISYTCEMASLYIQEVQSVEVSPSKVTGSVGETFQLQAHVVPAYADDLTVFWQTGDPDVASVDPEGRVTLIAPGSCEIVCRSACGKQDACQVEVAGAQ